MLHLSGERPDLDAVEYLSGLDVDGVGGSSVPTVVVGIARHGVGEMGSPNGLELGVSNMNNPRTIIMSTLEDHTPPFLKRMFNSNGRGYESRVYIKVSIAVALTMPYSDGLFRRVATSNSTVTSNSADSPRETGRPLKDHLEEEE